MEGSTINTKREKGAALDQDLIITKDRSTATITMNRPKVNNILTGSMYKGLTQSLYDLDREDEISVIVLRGAGERAFCAGSDVKDFLDKTVLERQKHFGYVAELMQAPSRIGKPVIAAVKGYAFGGGCALAAACDLTIATENSDMGMPEMEIGLFPMTIVPVIVRRIGVHKAFELIMLGEKFKGRKAAELGLINKAVPENEFEEEVSGWAAKLATRSPVAARMGKVAFYNSLDIEYCKAIKFMGNMMALNASSEDGAEGISAFLEKRKPRWLNR
jgi:enoyl-CoA hydratase